MNCAQFSLLPTTEYMGHRVEGATRHGTCPSLPPAHHCTQDGGVCSITGHAGQGKGRFTHTETPTAGTRQRTPLNIHSCTQGTPRSPTQPSPLSCRPPSRRNCIALREPPWGLLCQAPSPPHPHFGTSARHTAARVGTLPPRLLWLGVEEGGRRPHPPSFL